MFRLFDITTNDCIYNYLITDNDTALSRSRLTFSLKFESANNLQGLINSARKLKNTPYIQNCHFDTPSHCVLRSKSYGLNEQ